MTIDLVDLYLIAYVRVFIDRLDGLAFNKRGVPARHRLYPVEQFLQQQPSGEKHQTHIDWEKITALIKTVSHSSLAISIKGNVQYEFGRKM